MSEPFSPENRDFQIQPPGSEVGKPFSPDRLRDIKADLLDLKAHLNTAGEQSLARNFSFKESESGTISVEYVTSDGFAVQLEMEELDDQLRLDREGKTRSIRLPNPNIVGIRRYQITNTETGAQHDLMQPPFRNNTNTQLAMSINEPFATNMSLVTSEDTETGSRTAMEFFRRKESEASHSQNEYNNGVAFMELPMGVEDLADNFHEISHGDDPEINSGVEMFEELRDLLDKDNPSHEEQLRLDNLKVDAWKLSIAWETYATKHALDKLQVITTDMQNGDELLKRAKLRQGLGLSLYVPEWQYRVPYWQAYVKDDSIIDLDGVILGIQPDELDEYIFQNSHDTGQEKWLRACTSGNFSDLIQTRLRSAASEIHKQNS